MGPNGGRPLIRVATGPIASMRAAVVFVVDDRAVRRSSMCTVATRANTSARFRPALRRGFGPSTQLATVDRQPHRVDIDR